MAGQHELSLVPVNSPVGPTACSKYINVLYAPFHPRNFGVASFAFFRGGAVTVDRQQFQSQLGCVLSVLKLVTSLIWDINLGRSGCHRCFRSTSSADFDMFCLFVFFREERLTFHMSGLLLKSLQLN